MGDVLWCWVNLKSCQLLLCKQFDSCKKSLISWAWRITDGRTHAQTSIFFKSSLHKQPLWGNNLDRIERPCRISWKKTRSKISSTTMFAPYYLWSVVGTVLIESSLVNCKHWFRSIPSSSQCSGLRQDTNRSQNEAFPWNWFENGPNPTIETRALVHLLPDLPAVECFCFLSFPNFILSEDHRNFLTGIFSEICSRPFGVDFPSSKLAKGELVGRFSRSSDRMMYFVNLLNGFVTFLSFRFFSLTLVAMWAQNLTMQRCLESERSFLPSEWLRSTIRSLRNIFR